MATTSYTKTKPIEPKRKLRKPVLLEDVKPEINLKLPVRQPSLLSNLSITPGTTSRKFWEKVIAEVEHVKLCRKTPEIKILNHTDVLPPLHKERVKKIMPYEHSDTDDRIYFKDVLRSKKNKNFRHLSQLTKEENKEEPSKDHALPYATHPKKKEEYFNESEYSYILQKEREFKPFKLKIDKPQDHKHPDNQCWMAKYLSQTNKQRIIWKTKTYRKNPEVMKKDLTEQGEELMDITATRFIDWLKTIGSTESSDLTVLELKELFGFKTEHTLVYSMNDECKELKAIPKTVAKIWNLPNASIDHQYEKFLHRSKKTKPRLLSAFGRTIPPEDRPWITHFTDHPLKSAFPEEIMTRQRMFHGILDLQSIPPLVRYYLRHPKLTRPKYLVNSGAFHVKFARKKGKKGKEKGRLGKNTLYGKLGLDYLSCEYP